MVCLLTPRSGVFLHLPTLDESQPCVEWLRSYDVPVWYPWQKEQASNAKWASLAPPVHLLQIGTGAIVRSPSTLPTDVNTTAQHASSTPLDPTVVITTNAAPITQAEITQADIPSQPPPSWQDFFTFQKEHNHRQSERESLLDRQQHLARENKPPTKSAKVFHWVKDSSGQFVCESISKKW